LDINYESIFYKLDDINKINYLKEIYIDFNKIKRLTIENEDEDKNFDEDEDKDNTNNLKIKNFFEIIFSINNIKNNLFKYKV